MTEEPQAHDTTTSSASAAGTPSKVLAENFARLCELTRRKRPAAESIWSFLGHRITFGESLDPIVSGFWRLDSEELLNLIPASEPKALIPIPSLEKAFPAANDVLLTSTAGKRRVDPIPSNSLAGMLPNSSGRWRRYLALPMSEEEYTSFPIVKLSSTRPNSKTKFKLRRLHRQVLPVGQIKLKFDEPTTIRKLAISSPEYATIDWVVAHIELNLAEYARSIDECLNLVKEFRGENGVASLLKSEVEIIVTRLDRDLLFLADQVDGAVADARRETDRRLFHRQLNWSNDLRRSAEQVRAWRNKHPDPDECGLDEVIERAKQLAASLPGSCYFAYPAKISEEESSAELAQVELDGLVDAMEPLEEYVTLSELIIPFTTEREPTTQPKRSGTILLVLAAVMLLISTIDLSWTNDRVLLERLGPLPGPPDDVVEFKDLREPLVALLLIFPAALYLGQFFQTRPRGSLGTGVQLSTFAALSLVFTLPIVPAVLLAIGWGSAVLSVFCAVTAAVAVIAGVAVLRVFSKRSLQRLRFREITLSVRDRMSLKRLSLRSRIRKAIILLRSRELSSSKADD